MSPAQCRCCRGGWRRWWWRRSAWCGSASGRGGGEPGEGGGRATAQDVVMGEQRRGRDGEGGVTLLLLCGGLAGRPVAVFCVARCWLPGGRNILGRPRWPFPLPDLKRPRLLAAPTGLDLDGQQLPDGGWWAVGRCFFMFFSTQSGVRNCFSVRFSSSVPDAGQDRQAVRH